ncbi:MAG: site-specific DNA-methyltransferase [Dehalococcoidia bacterium]
MANGVELVWEGKKKEVERVALPFQRVEVINESRGSRREAPLFASGRSLPADPLFAQPAGDQWPAGWRNKLIWGDNKYVLGSLVEEFAGKLDLVYIDPPFNTGTDFSFQVAVGQQGLVKEASSIEETAYRDTWGGGLPSYLSMLWERLGLVHQLLSPTGSLYIHIGPNVSHLVRAMVAERFGAAGVSGEIIWQRTSSHGDSHWWGVVHDVLLFSTKSSAYKWNSQSRPFTEQYVSSHYGSVEQATGRSFSASSLTAAGTRMGETGQPWRGFDPNTIGRHWAKRPSELEQLDAQGRIYWPKKAGGWPREKLYLDERTGRAVSNIWDDIPNVNSQAKEDTGYDTQKPEALLERLIRASSNEGDLIADVFCGSGTTMAVAERLGRRWIGCDLGRFAIHTARKRLLEIPNCKPFEVLNLGRYQRRYWQGINAGEAVFEYLKFIVELYHGEPIVGFSHLHGRKGGSMIHVGATDAPVTFSEVRDALDECKANDFKALDVLAWEWEMGLNDKGRRDLEREFGIEVHLFHIPHEVMDKRAVDAGDVHFFEAAYVEAELRLEGQEVTVELKDFLVAIDDYMRTKVGDAIKKWSDWIDYWAVDFDYNGDVFHNQWQSYRTRKEPKLELISNPHRFAEGGKKQILVKVVDIFGNDTTALLDVEV